MKLKPDIVYPREFEVQWNATHKTGSKAKALNEWESFSRPAFGAAWTKWARLDSWRRGFVPHVATWLYDRRFQQEPAEPRKVPNNAPTPRSGDPMPIRDVAAATDAKLARDRSLTPATPEQIAELKAARGAQ